MSAAQTGLKRGPYSAEHRAAISEAKKGKARPDKLKNVRKVICVETGLVYENASSAERAMGKRCSGNLLKVLRGEVDSFSGYHWAWEN